MTLLAIVPARGGSVGIPRKNVRVIDGVPLVLAKLNALRSAGLERIVCSTDDPVIESIARQAGYETHRRTAATAGPSATIAETAAEVVATLGWTGPVGVFQVTSPGLTAERIRTEVEDFLADDSLCTAVSVAAVHDRCYSPGGDVLGSGWNRQDQPEPTVWRETGGIRLYRDAARLDVDLDGHHLIELTGPEAVDIDDHAQLAGIRQALHTTELTFVAAVGHSTGTGHLHRCLVLADELAHHHVRFVLIGSDGDDRAPWEAAVARSGYELAPVDFMPTDGVVVLDILDTEPGVVADFQRAGNRVVTLEDLGPGALVADATINELYAEGTYAGPAYAVLRPEFLSGRTHAPSQEALRPGDGARVLVCFGGTDPGAMGPRLERLLPTPPLAVTRYGPGSASGLPPIAEAMATHHVLVSSCGRTIHEAAAVGIPTIGIPVNAREELHARLDSVLYLPRAELVTDHEILNAVGHLLDSQTLRAEMSVRGQAQVDGRGAQRIASIITDLIEGL